MTAGVLAALGSAAAWALGAILYKRIGESASASGMNLVKSVLSLLILSAALLASGIRALDWRTFAALALSGGLGIALGDTFFFLSLQELDAHLLVIMCALGQVLTVLLGVLWLGERPSPGGWLGMGMIIGGVAAVLAARGASGSRPFNARGVAQGLLAVLCMSVAVVIAKVELAGVSAIEATSVRMLGGAVGLGLWGAATGGLGRWTAPFRDVALLRKLLAAVCVSSLGGFWLFHVALKTLALSTANTLCSTEPLFVLPLAAVFLNEKVTRRAVLGAVVSIGGIALLSARG